jgi:putative peptidoglycan lipid II flippase
MLVKAIFTNSSGILASRIMGFLRDMAMASILGANIYSDIFFVAFKIPNLFRTVFAEGAFTQAFIPAFSRSKKKVRFTTIIFSQLLFVLILLSLLVTLFSYAITSIIAVGFDEKAIDIASPLVAINFYYLPLIFCVTFLGAILQYKHHFSTTAYSTALLNLAMIISLYLAQGLHESEIVYYLSFGVLAGGILQVVTHLVSAKNKKVTKFFLFKQKIIFAKSEVTNSFYKTFLPAILGSSTAHIAAFIDTMLASFLTAGSISYLYYANRIFQLPLALFAIATSVALFPAIAKAIKNCDENLALDLLKKSFWSLLIILFLSALIGIVFNNEIIKLLFERGAFNENDTRNTAIVLAMYLIGLLPFGLAKIFSLWLYSHQKQIITAKISAKSLVFNIAFSLVLIAPFGAAGLAFSSTMTGFVLFFLTIKEFGFSLFLNKIIKI